MTRIAFSGSRHESYCHRRRLFQECCRRRAPARLVAHRGRSVGRTQGRSRAPQRSPDRRRPSCNSNTRSRDLRPRFTRDPASNTLCETDEVDALAVWVLASSTCGIEPHHQPRGGEQDGGEDPHPFPAGPFAEMESRSRPVGALTAWLWSGRWQPQPKLNGLGRLPWAVPLAWDHHGPTMTATADAAMFNSAQVSWAIPPTFHREQ